MKKYLIVKKYEHAINLNGSDCHREILDVIKSRLDDSLQDKWKHCGRVQITRIDITFPIGWSDGNCNALFSRFLWQLKLGLNGDIIHYVWIKEKNSSINPHFHLIVFRNGQQHCSGYQIRQAASLAWGRLLRCSGEGLVHITTPSIDGAYCNYGVVLDKNASGFPMVYEAVHYWLSYLAKTNTKTTESGHSYGASLLR